MLICEELFLLLTNDRGAPEGWGTQRGWGLSAALITDLMVHRRVAVVFDKKNPRIDLVDAAPTGSPVLDAAIGRLGQKHGKRFSWWVKDRALNPEADVAQSLAYAGVITIEPKRLLGVIPARYPVRNPAPEQALRERLRLVLAGDHAPGAADAAELALLKALKVAGKVLAQEAAPLRGRALNQRIDQVAADVPAADAVTRAIAELASVMAVSFMAAGAAGS